MTSKLEKTGPIGMLRHMLELVDQWKAVRLLAKLPKVERRGFVDFLSKEYKSKKTEVQIEHILEAAVHNEFLGEDFIGATYLSAKDDPDNVQLILLKPKGLKFSTHTGFFDILLEKYDKTIVFLLGGGAVGIVWVISKILQIRH